MNNQKTVRPRPEVGHCCQCDKLTDIYVGTVGSVAQFCCNSCNDTTMGWMPGMSALLALGMVALDASKEVNGNS
jgi:hypothetical protein